MTSGRARQRNRTGVDAIPGADVSPVNRSQPADVASLIAELDWSSDTGQRAAKRIAELVAMVAGVAAAVVALDGDRWRLVAQDGLPRPATWTNGSDLSEMKDLCTVEAVEAALPLRADTIAGINEIAIGGVSAILMAPDLGPDGVVIVGDPGPHRPFIELVNSAVASIRLRRELNARLAGLSEEQIEITRLLAIRDVDQLLLSTVNTANRLIDGDMAGVMLVDRDDLVMECCVGNRSRRTEQLRFSKGQGVAGLVMERGEPCKVDDYLQSRVITHHFDSLARIEETKSALAAPLVVEAKTIGVLEVWRRRPSVFSEANVRQLVTLANLAAIAIDNARLHALKADSLERLALTTESLSRQLSTIEQARSTQTTLSQLLLQGEGVGSICRAIASKLDAEVALLSSELQVMSRWPQDLDVDDVVARLRALPGVDRPGAEQLSVQLEPGRWLAAQAVRAGSDHLGWFCVVLADEPQIGEDLVIGEAVTVTALCQIMERTAEAARSGERESLVWNLIEGPIAQRRAAVDRARWLRVDLSRRRRLVRGEIVPSYPSRRVTWDEAEYERARQRVLAKVRSAAMTLGVGELVAIRGNDLALIVPDRDLPTLRDMVAQLDEAAASVLSGHSVAWGVSNPCSNLLELDRANDEAISAVRAAVRLGLDHTAMYQDLGVVRLIVSDDDGDLRQFLHDIIGPLLEHDAERNSELVDTLRAYFVTDYSHQHAANLLHIHHKTFGYRLAKIESLTGLDMRSHDGRMRADLALKLHDVANGP